MLRLFQRKLTGVVVDVSKPSLSQVLLASRGFGKNIDTSSAVWALSTRLISSQSDAPEYTTINVKLDEGVGIISISRPRALNALNSTVIDEIVRAAVSLDSNSAIGAMIITGEGPKAFAAGADIKEMAPLSYSQAFSGGCLQRFDDLNQIRKPIIAAVNGYSLGGGCELAMACDIAIASENTEFGQPEVTLGVIPGMGGTQRLVRAVGKSKAMEMILSGKRVSAVEAEKMGLVSRVVPSEQLLPEALKLARKVAGFSGPVVAKAKDCVNRAFEMSLAEGLRYEKREFWSCFALADQKEGMAAFVEKRKPAFKNE